MSNLESVSSDVQPFKLKSSSGNFAQKLNSVFDGLDALEKRHEEWQVSKGEENLTLLKSDPIDQQDDAISRDDNFKKPQIQPSRKRHFQSNVPDFKKHPEKWTKYTLRDVPGADISDAGNRDAAFSFLEEMRQRRAQDYSTDNVGEEEQMDDFKPVLFGVRSQNSQRSAGSAAESATKPSMAHGGKFIMPECVVGMPNPSKKNQNRKRIVKEKSDKSIHLDHLNEDDSDDDIEDVRMNQEGETSTAATEDAGDTAQAKTRIRALRQNRCDDD